MSGESLAPDLIDYEELTRRLIVLLPGRMAASFAIDHLSTHVRAMLELLESADKD